MAAVKNNERIHTRSPFYINAVPTNGNISSATLDITLQTGTRLDAGSMTNLKTYTLTSTNAINNVIVFNVSPLIQDYIEFSTGIYDKITTFGTADDQEILYMLWELSTVDASGTVDTSGYYVGIEGYSKFSDGVNWVPSTGATGNYGNPAWSPATAKGTARTIAATQCYRQMSEDSYAILPVYMGEFDEDNTDADTNVRLAFGPYTNAFTSSSSLNEKLDLAIAKSDLRDTTYKANLVYMPIGKKNLPNDWISGYDYLTAGHIINRTETASGKPTTTITLTSNRGTSLLAGAQLDIDLNTELSEFDLDIGDTVTLDLPAFTGIGPCTSSYGASTVTTTYSSTVNPTTIRVDVTGGASVEARVDCFFTSLGEALFFDVTLPQLNTINDIALVNDNPLIRYEIICEPKYNVVDFFFINRWGAWDCFTFLKASRESYDVKSETHYKSIGTVVSNAYSYDTTNNQIQRYNINGKKTYTLNTGYVDESFSLLLEEIMATPRAFMIYDGVEIQVNVKDSNQEFRKHVNERLINYTIEVEASNDHINNVV